MQTSYPLDSLPSSLRDYVDVCVHSGTPVEVAVPFAITSISLLALADCEIETWGGETIPPSINFVLVSESGVGKSFMRKRAFKGHKDADAASYKAWRALRTENALKRRKNTPIPPEEEATSVAPISVQDDATNEALIEALAGGRYAQAYVDDEGYRWSDGWSMNESNRAKAMAEYNKIYDGEPIWRRRASGADHYAHRPRLSLLVAAQGDEFLTVLLDAKVSGGFAARALYFREDDEPERMPLSDAQQHVINNFTTRVYTHRLRQDQYAHLAVSRDKEMLSLSLSPAQVRAFFKVDKVWRSLAKGTSDPIMRSVLKRRTDRVLRLAALFALADYYLSGPLPKTPDQQIDQSLLLDDTPDDGEAPLDPIFDVNLAPTIPALVIGDAHLTGAQKIVEWHDSVLEMMLGTNAGSRASKAAAQVRKFLIAAEKDPKDYHKIRRDDFGDAEKATIPWGKVKMSVSPLHRSKDEKFVLEVKNYIIEAGWVSDLGSGRIALEPELWEED